MGTVEVNRFDELSFAGVPAAVALAIAIFLTAVMPDKDDLVVVARTPVAMAAADTVSPAAVVGDDTTSESLALGG